MARMVFITLFGVAAAVAFFLAMKPNQRAAGDPSNTAVVSPSTNPSGNVAPSAQQRTGCVNCDFHQP
ncbi:MAG: hypothetical protein L0Z62_01185 [Gemmataceae bacterium]|nr:hypothetical protein [Gemmataceae bacterium]